MASILELVKHLQSTIEKYPTEEHKVLKCIDKLYSLGVTVSHLQETGVGRTVNALRKEPGDVGTAARALVNKWKLMVAAEENSDPEDYNHDASHYNGNGNGKDSDDNLNQSRNGDRHGQSQSGGSQARHNEYKLTNGDHSGSKRKYPSSEDEPDMKKSRHNQNNDSKVKVKIEPKTESESEEDSHSEDSESSESEVEVKKEKTSSPETHKSRSSQQKYSVEVKKEKDIKKEKDTSSSKSHDFSSRHSKDKESRHSEDQTKDRSSSSHKHKSSKEKENSEEKHKSKHKSRESDKEKSSSSKHSSSDKHKSSHKSSSDEKISSSKSSDKVDKHASQSHKEKHKSSSEKDRRDKSSSKDKHSSDKERSKKDSSKEKSSHSSRSDKKSSESTSKDKGRSDKLEKSGESGSEKESKRSSSSHKSSKSKDDSKKKMPSEDSDDGIGCESGASFAEALGMVSPAKSVKKKLSRETSSPGNSFLQDLGAAALLAPTAKLAPLPPLEISSLPEISPHYKPRPPPRLLPHFNDEEAISVGISSKNQRTKVYSGNKILGKIPTLYELCVQVLQEHIDALEYTGGVPYDILKPVVDRATPQQLFMLEHYNPYLMEDTDHLWQKCCEKHFRNKKRQELETWREMYMRCQEEQEHRLKSLTANIKLTQEAKKAPVKQTKMAYVDSVVKPPRNIARKQAIHGTARTAAASPAARVAALAAPGVVRAGAARAPAAAPASLAALSRPKKAPLMAKALQLMRGGRKR